MRDVASSRRRLIEAADDERERLGDQLRTGAEQRLAAIGDRLAALAPANDGATAVAVRALVTDLDAARADLQRFSQGIHPRALTESGTEPGAHRTGRAGRATGDTGRVRAPLPIHA